MSLQVEKLEKNMAKLTITVDAATLDKAMNVAYNKAKGRIAIPGFRKGKAPRKMIEKLYGKGVFLEDAVNSLIPEEYNNALAECELQVTSQPEIEVVEVEPGKDLVFTATVAVRPEVTLGQYKGIEVPKTEINVTDEEVMDKINKELERSARTEAVEDAAKDGDIVTLDFEGSVDGVAFDGGKGDNYPLTLGSNSFIPGFEAQLVGAKAGEHVEVNVTFPEDYAAELAGKAAVFQCDIKKVERKDVPVLDADFAEDKGFDSVDEYKEDVKNSIIKDKEEKAANVKEDRVVDAIIANAEMEIPEPMVMSQARQMVDNMLNQFTSQGISAEQYYQITGMTEEKVLDSAKPQALKQIQTRLVLEEIAKAEGIEIAQEEIDAEIKRMADTYQMDLETVKGLLTEAQIEGLKTDLSVQKAITLVADAAVEVEAAAE